VPALGGPAGQIRIRL